IFNTFADVNTETFDSDCNFLSNKEDASESIPGINWLDASTNVTEQFKLAKTEAISTPITPPPTITSDSGIDSRSKIVSLVCTSTLSIPLIGGIFGLEPVAIIIFSPYIVSSLLLVAIVMRWSG